MISRIKSDEQPEVNVKVIVRCRPFSQYEKKDPTQYQVLSAKVATKELLVSQTIPGRKVESYNKTYTFDGVCNQYTAQDDLFRIYIIPIVEEVLHGFNCTIFAYGQTGTGKTYTMEGDLYDRTIKNVTESGSLVEPTFVSSSETPSKSIDLVLTEEAGIIPRAVKYIFEKLEGQDSEYSVRVSYLEIYNEELHDLLNDGEKQILRIFEDPNSKKGLAVDRLEEITVNSPQDIIQILSTAVKKRRTAETLLNRQSSRSHCIFSLTIHMKETNIDGEDVIKIGKLNLVDLAGSENIQKSGANCVKNRAKEAGMINQSLLTLGRVINALVEHSSYIPYRDSKLTRLLQDSLGGRTKTCIVATVSPSSLCLEETLSTLDYAFRAKNIRNRPEINQRMTKRVMIRELNKELERLRSELTANRERNGVYIPLDQFMEMQSKLSAQTIELAKANSEINTVKEMLQIKSQELNEYNDNKENELRQQKQLQISYDNLNAEYSALLAGMNRLKLKYNQKKENSFLTQSKIQKLLSLNKSIESKLKLSSEELLSVYEELNKLQSNTKDMMNKISKFLSNSHNNFVTDIVDELNNGLLTWNSYFPKFINEYTYSMNTENANIKERLIVFEDLSSNLVKFVEGKYKETESSVTKCINDHINSYNDDIQSIKNYINSNLTVSVKNISNSFDKIKKNVLESNREIIDVDLQQLKDLADNQLADFTVSKKQIESDLQNLTSNTLLPAKNVIINDFNPLKIKLEDIITHAHNFERSIKDSVQSFITSLENSMSKYKCFISQECTDLISKQNNVSRYVLENLDSIESQFANKFSPTIISLLESSISAYNQNINHIGNRIEEKISKTYNFLDNNHAKVYDDIYKIETFFDRYISNEVNTCDTISGDQSAVTNNDYESDYNISNKENLNSISDDSNYSIKQPMQVYAGNNTRNKVLELLANFSNEQKTCYNEYCNSISAVKLSCDDLLENMSNLQVDNYKFIDDINTAYLKTNENLNKKTSAAAATAEAVDALNLNQLNEEINQNTKSCIKTLQMENKNIEMLYKLISDGHKELSADFPPEVTYNALNSIVNPNDTSDSCCCDQLLKEDSFSVKTPVYIKHDDSLIQYDILDPDESFRQESTMSDFKLPSKSHTSLLENDIKTSNNNSQVKLNRDSIDTPIPATYNLDVAILMKSNKQSQLSSQSTLTENKRASPAHNLLNQSNHEYDDDAQSTTKYSYCLSHPPGMKNLSLSQNLHSKNHLNHCKSGENQNNESNSSQNKQQQQLAPAAFVRTKSDFGLGVKESQNNRVKPSLSTPKTACTNIPNKFKSSCDLSSSSSSFIDFKPRHQISDFHTSSSSFIARTNRKRYTQKKFPSLPNDSNPPAVLKKTSEYFASPSFQEPTKITQLNTRKKFTSNKNFI